MRIRSLGSILAVGLVMVVGTGFAQTWQRNNLPQPDGVPPLNCYGPLRMSADGRIICAVVGNFTPVISTNGGTRWDFASLDGGGAARNLGGVAVSADASRIYAALSSTAAQRTRVFVATEQGTNWQYTGYPEIKAWTTNNSVACSADGANVIAALGPSAILYSTNGGTDFYTSSVSPANWTSLASSADSGRMVAAASEGNVYFSEDFGANWTAADLPAEAWSSVCVSANGKWIGATSDTHSYISSDSGVTWLTNDFGGLGISCSANGTVWLITSAQVETSTDGGQTWQANLSTDQWSGCAMSADGKLMEVLGTGQGAWIGRLGSSPQLSIQQKNTSLAISWLVPSTNFVLQQSADLTAPNWVTVTNTPALNFTNLQQEVTLPATPSNAFFRLTTQ